MVCCLKGWLRLLLVPCEREKPWLYLCLSFLHSIVWDINPNYVGLSFVHSLFVRCNTHMWLFEGDAYPCSSPMWVIQWRWVARWCRWYALLSLSESSFRPQLFLLVQLSPTFLTWYHSSGYSSQLLPRPIQSSTNSCWSNLSIKFHFLYVFCDPKDVSSYFFSSSILVGFI